MLKQKKSNCKTCEKNFKCLAQKVDNKKEFCLRCENRLKCTTSDNLLCLDTDFRAGDGILTGDSFITYKPIGGWKQSECFFKGKEVAIVVKA